MSEFFLIAKFHIYGAIFTALIGISVPIVIKINFERNILKLTFFEWINWNELGKIIIISLVPAVLPLIVISTVHNIYICFISGAILYFSSVIFLESRFSLFIYPQVILRFKYLVFKNNPK